MSSAEADALAGRSAVVTGASSGIGHAIAQALARRRVRLVVVARGEDRLQRVARELGAEAFAADVSDEGAVARLARHVERSFGEAAPDVLVNAAGAFALAPLAATPASAFDAQLAANLRAPFLTIRRFLPAMLERGSGDVVTIGSVAGRRAFPRNGAYAASKYGVRGLHEVLELELRGTGVRCTLVEPSATDTPLWDDVAGAGDADLPPRAAMLAPARVARAVLFALDLPRDVAVPFLPVGAS